MHAWLFSAVNLSVSQKSEESRHHLEIFKQRAAGQWRNTAIFSWMVSEEDTFHEL